MIFVTEQPTENAIFLDSQLIHFESHTEAEHTRIIARIFEPSTVLFEEYNWPKFTPTQLKHSIRGYVRNKSIHETLVLRNIWKINNLFKTGVVLIEHTGRTSISTKQLNTFFIMHSNNNLESLPISSLEFLGISESLLIHSEGVLSIPFFSNSIQPISIVLVDQDNNSIFSGSIQAEKAYYLFEKELLLPYNVESLTFTLSSGATVITKKIRVIKNTAFPPLNVRFVNQFGAKIHCQFFASMEEKNDFDNTIYKDQKNQMYNAEIVTKSTLSINTGYLFNDEKFIIEQILNSTNVEIEYKGKYIPVVSSTKSIKPFLAKEYLNTQLLTFTFDKNGIN